MRYALCPARHALSVIYPQLNNSHFVSPELVEGRIPHSEFIVSSFFHPFFQPLGGFLCDRDSICSIHPAVAQDRSGLSAAWKSKRGLQIVRWRSGSVHGRQLKHGPNKFGEIVAAGFIPAKAANHIVIHDLFKRGPS